MKRRTTICALAFLAPVGVWLFGANIFALAWHASHGFHREMNGVRFHVPLLYQENDGSAYNQFSFYTWPSAFHHKDGSITVDFQKQPSKKPFQPLDERSQQALGMSLRGQRPAKLANQSGNCFEYRIDELTLIPARHGSERVRIECRFADDVLASFNGSSNAVPEFYSFLNEAELVKQKQI